MRRMVALALSVALASAGCASTANRHATARIGAPGQAAARHDPTLFTEFVKKIPVGSRVRLGLANGQTIRGTLMRADTDPIVVQRRTRMPEAPIEIRVADLLTMELDQPGTGPGKAIAIGVASGAGAALGVLMILAAIFAD